MEAEDRNEEVTTQGECTDCTERERSFDALARGLANGSISRGRALRLLGSALLGGAVASIPGVGWLAGDGGEAQAAAPGGSTCANEGQSCTAQKCCQGLTCIGQSGNKVCCPKTRACGSVCCAPNQQCLANNVCGGCPSGQVLCATQANPAGECCPAPTGPDAPCRVAACGNGTCTTSPKSGSNGTPCNDLNPCTDNDVCTNGVCAGTQISGCVLCQNTTDCSGVNPFGTAPNQCQQVVCGSQGFCVIENKANGTGCNDGNPCTENDKCTNGVCAGTQITGCVRCNSPSDCPTPTNQCQQATCTGGVCGVTNKNNGTACNDNNPCTDNDKCTDGVCAGTLREGCVLCSGNADCATVPVDQCHQAVCGAQGFCVVENKANGTNCNDGNPCTENDKCTNGVCAGTQIEGCVLCQGNTDCANVPVDQCHQAVCGAQGFCVVENKANGTQCNDNNPCTDNDKCTNGVCAGTQIEGCVLCQGNTDCANVPVDQCHQAVCGAQGFCVIENKANGTNCNDNNPCTDNDKCTNGVCAGTQIEGCVLCSGNTDCANVPVDQCHQAVCGAQGFCVVENKANGTQCNDNNPCTDNDKCTEGVCAGTQIEGCVLCSGNTDCASVPVDQCHQAVCGALGFCVVENKADNTSCNDGNPCTENDKCTNGVCAGTQIEGCVLCQNTTDCANVPVDQCHQAVCGPQGFCVVENKTNGTQCNDANPCTDNDRCTDGVCAGTLREGCVLCQNTTDCANVPVDQCHRAVCGSEGFCVVENKPNGTSCNDANPCTENDQCTNGVCAGTQIEGCVLCQNTTDCANVPVDQCHQAVCGALGFCVVENKADNTSCNDGNPCTENDKCTNGVCAGTQIEGCVLCQNTTDCANVPVDQCHQAVCGPQGFCVVENKTNGTQCNDANPCTENDKCTNGVCAGTQIEGCVLCQGNTDCATFGTPDQCHEAYCQANGTCGIRNKADNTTCNDGNPCTTNDKCTNGACAGTQIEGCVTCTTASTCPQPTNQCQEATCNNGICGVENKPDNTTCNDNNPCTTNDKCTGGVCAGTQITGCVTCTTANDCPQPTNQCQQATCNGGVCGVENKPDNTTCNDNNPCTTNDKCTGGVCAGTQITGCVVCAGTACQSPNICCAANSASPNQCKRPTGASCTGNGQCCSNNCAGTGNNKTCA